ncbi:21438_t:CDS:2, partial [Gigaspora rosea]
QSSFSLGCEPIKILACYFLFGWLTRKIEFEAGRDAIQFVEVDIKIKFHIDNLEQIHQQLTKV